MNVTDSNLNLCAYVIDQVKSTALCCFYTFLAQPPIISQSSHQPSQQTSLFSGNKNNYCPFICLLHGLCTISMTSILHRFFLFAYVIVISRSLEPNVQEIDEGNLTSALRDWECDLGVMFYAPWCQYCKYVVAAALLINSDLILFNVTKQTIYTFLG